MGKTLAKVMGMGGGAGALEAQQAKQQALIDKANANTAAIAAGQKKAAGAGGGFLSFLDDQLKSTFGG